MESHRLPHTPSRPRRRVLRPAPRAARAARRLAPRAARAGARIAFGAAWVIALLALCAASATAQLALLDVTVRDGQTGDPIPGAFVMVGRWVGNPFEDNYGWTNSSGWIRFIDESLSAPQTVTAGAEGYGYTTLCEAALGQVTLPLYAPLPDSTMAGSRATVSGEVDNIATVSNDGNLDIALVLPVLPVSEYALQDRLRLITWTEQVDFPIVGEVEMPSNTFMPGQVEGIFFYFSKSPYALDVPAGGTQTFYAVSARIAIDDLSAGDISQAVPREMGVERDVPVSGPRTLDINSDLALSTTLTAELLGVPAGARMQAISAAFLDVDGVDHAVGFDTKGDLLVRDETFTLAGRNPGGDLADVVNAAIGTFADSSLAQRYFVGIIDRGGFTLPHTVTFDSWMQTPELSQFQRDYLWVDPTTPGVSPAPTWTRSSLGLRPIDPADLSVATSVDWRIYAPAGPGAFELPALPEVAPGPAGGLPDPAATPGADQLYWRWVAADSDADATAILVDFLRGATHWTSGWIEITAPHSAVRTDPRALRVRLAALRLPGGGAALRWDGGPVAAGSLELLDLQGRRLWSAPVSLDRGELRWDGRDRWGRALPGGLYWAALRGERTLLARARWLQLTP